FTPLFIILIIDVLKFHQKFREHRLRWPLTVLQSSDKEVDHMRPSPSVRAYRLCFRSMRASDICELVSFISPVVPLLMLPLRTLLESILPSTRRPPSDSARLTERVYQCALDPLPVSGWPVWSMVHRFGRRQWAPNKADLSQLTLLKQPLASAQFLVLWAREYSLLLQPRRLGDGRGIGANGRRRCAAKGARQGPVVRRGGAIAIAEWRWHHGGAKGGLKCPQQAPDWRRSSGTAATAAIGLDGASASKAAAAFDGVSLPAARNGTAVRYRIWSCFSGYGTGGQGVMGGGWRLLWQRCWPMAHLCHRRFSTSVIAPTGCSPGGW
ncbi:hypothetical protein Vretimale_2072, partial [Volvox reticuliferus]